MESGRLIFGRSACEGNALFLGSGSSIFREGSRMMMTSMEEGSRRRPFFCSPDELFDEEYYDEQLPDKKRRLTSDQVHMLEKSFEEENKLEPERKTQLAKNLGLQPRQVAVWFQNRRARWKTKQLERDYDLLKSSYDALLSDYSSIAKQTDLLKSEVISLTEKLQAREVSGLIPPDSGHKHDSSPADMAAADDVSTQQMSIKVEDRLSSGTSAVVDEDGPQLVDSGDSYLPNEEDYPTDCMAPQLEGIQSEEDEYGSEDGQSYFPNVFNPAPQHQSNNEGEALNWWVWS